jgi:hypothetical protein
MKVLLLPVMLVLTVLQIFLRIATEVFSIAAGLLTFIIFGCLVFTLIRHRWGDALILFLMESGVVLAMLCPVAAGELLDTAGSSLGTFLRS